MSQLPIVNRTVVRTSGLIPLFDALFDFEIFLTTTGFFLVLLAVRYRSKSKFHVNIRRIVFNYAGTFALLSWSRFVMISLTMDWDANGDLIDDPLFFWAGTLRCYFIMVAGLSLPAATVERIVATACVYDYETKRRTYVSSWLIMGTNVVSLLCAFSIMNATYMTLLSYAKWLSAAFHLVAILIANAFGLAGFLCCHKKNSTFYSGAMNYDFEKQRSDRHYSLSQRFQIVENIRVGHLLKYYYLSIWIFNLMICVIYLTSMVLDDQVAVNITYEMFDIGIAMYANVVPLLNMPKNPAFQADWNRFLIRWGFRTCSVNDAQGKTYVKTVFGANLPCSPREQAATYFVQLEGAWSADPKMRKA